MATSAVDFKSGLRHKNATPAPVVRMTAEAMAAGHATARHPTMRPAMEKATGEHHQVGAEDGESKRTVVQPSNNPAVNQALATAAMPEFEARLKKAIKGIAGAQIVATRDFKNPQRLGEKVNQEGQPPQTVGDYGAAQISVDSPEAKDEVLAAVRKEFPVAKEKDLFDKGDDDYGFRHISLQLQMPNHATIELQIVPREVMDANPGEHHDYKAAREAEISGKDSEFTKHAATAKTKNDSAMAAFVARNKVGESNSEREGGRGESPERVAGGGLKSIPATKASPPSSNEVAKREVKVGSAVRLRDGTHAKVDYVPHPKSPFPAYRMRGMDGKRHNIRGRDIDGVTVLSDEWVGVDLDKTLAHFTVFKGATSIGKPLPEMVDRVKQMLKDGEHVKIFTARIANDPTGAARKAIEQWCEKYLGMKLPITNKKDDKMKLLYDDRAREVEPNKGTLVADSKQGHLFHGGLQKKTA